MAPRDIPRSEGLRGFWRSCQLAAELRVRAIGVQGFGLGAWESPLLTQRSVGGEGGLGGSEFGALTVFEAVRSMEAAHGHRTSSSLLTAIVLQDLANPYHSAT